MKTNLIKKISILTMLVFAILVTPAVFAYNEETHQLLITSTSSLIDDLDLLNIDYEKYKTETPIENEKIEAIFKNQEEVFIYMYVSDTVAKDYALASIMINDTDYMPSFCNEIVLGNGTVSNTLRKYRFKYYFNVSDTAFQFHITRYKYLHLLKAEFMNHNTDENHYFGYDNDNYYYEAQFENTIELQGRLFSYTIDVTTTLKDVFTNMWYSFSGTSKENEKIIYYMAINFFDKNIQEYFTPDYVTSISIKYLEQNVKETWSDFAYYYKSSVENYDFKQTKSGDTVKEQTIKPKDVTIDYSNGFEKVFSMLFTNGKMNTHYDYKTIAKVNQEDLSADLYSLVQGYDYVVSGLGDEQGYAYNTSFKTYMLSTPEGNDYGVKYDYTRAYTQVSEVNIFKTSYWYKGNHYEVNCDSIMSEKIDVDPTDPGTGKYDGENDIWTDIINFIKKYVVYFLIGLGAIIFVIVFSFFKSISDLIIGLWKGLKFMIKAIIFIITLPFKILNKLFNFIFKRKKKYKKRKKSKK